MKGLPPTTPDTDALSPDLQRSNLSRSQLMIWTGQRMNPGVPLYNMAFRFDIDGDVDVAAFGAAFQRLIDGCDALRLVFFEDDGIPMQRVLPTLRYDAEFIDLSAVDDPDAAATDWIAARCRVPFELTRRCFDCALIKTGPSRFVWFLGQHHLTMDAWSTTVVYRNLAHLYAAQRRGDTDTPDSLPAYADYLAYERGFRGTPAHTEATAFWHAQAALPARRNRLYGRQAETPTTDTQRIACPLGHARSRQLRELAQTPGIRTLSLDMSLFNLIATVVFAYLWRISGNTVQVIGTPAHNRSSLAFRDTVGLFIEFFPLRVELDEEETFATLLDKVSGATQTFLRHAQPSTSSPAGARLFNVVLNYIHVAFDAFDGLPVKPEWLHAGSGDPAHELRIQVHDFSDSGELIVNFDVNEAVFPVPRRELAPQHFLRLLDACLERLDQPIARVALATDAERQRFLDTVDTVEDTADTAPAQVVTRLFRRRADRFADGPAVLFEGTSLSYRELDERSDDLARAIRARGVRTGMRVAIFLERSPDMVCSILGVLKTGAAYVPLETGLPAQRLSFILEDTDAQLVLTHTRLQSRLPDDGPAKLELDSDWRAKTCAGPVLPDPSPTQAAYVIYTSGSTGLPKGVVVDHAGLSAYAQWALRTFSPARRPAFPLYSSFGFDLTVTSIFVPLISGGSIVVYPEYEGTTDLSVLRVFEEDRVDVVKLTPAHLRLVADADLQTSRIGALVLGGEDLKTAPARRVVSASRGRIAVFNEYGPTEGIVGCMVHRYDPATDTGTSVPIGVPADGVSIYVLDSGLNPVPAGVSGELFIAGRLADGYLNRDELTAERFIDDPFHAGRRMYRSGDVGRFRDDGILEYLGRNDQQVKIRGVRVEPAEIEHALLAHPVIDACTLKVVHTEQRDTWDKVRYCSSCGLASNYPGARIDASGICNLCRDHAHYREAAEAYFGSTDQLRAIFDDARARQRGPYDCLMLLSGGKDSTYALYQIAGIARRVLAVTLDNGYISDGAKANIGRVVESLGVEHRFLSTPAMNAIFVDSLERHSNVCHGCFKTLYTLAVRTALDEGIPLIVTGLSRGQFFETRLTPEQFVGGRVDVAAIDQTVLDARKAYHRIDDAVSRLLDVDVFRDDGLFEQVRFVDFYRYSDVSLDEMYRFLAEHAPWIRPADTGRSTNCLINDVGIYVHKRKEGFHNYALPYSWDVRLGHKQREAALDELNDRIDIDRVHRILDDIGYTEDLLGNGESETRLIAYFTAGNRLGGKELRTFLAERLPVATIPSDFVQLEAIPLTVNGKVDRDALPDPRIGRPPVDDIYRAPSGDMETRLAAIWRDVLRVQRVGADDNFFDLGGDSIGAIQIAAKANDAGITLTPQLLFQHQTVSELACAVPSDAEASSGRTPAPTRDDARAPGRRVDPKELDKLAGLLGRS